MRHHQISKATALQTTIKNEGETLLMVLSSSFYISQSQK